MIDKNKDKEILNYLTNEKGNLMSGRCGAPHLQKKGYLDYLMQRYNDNTVKTDKVLSEILYRLKRNIEVVPTCPVCGKSIIFDEISKNYQTWCSRKCANNDPEVLEKNRQGVSKSLKAIYSDPDKKEQIINKKKQVFLEKYGTETSSPFGVKCVQDKAKATTLERYGVENVFSLKGYRCDNTELPKQQAKALWASRGFDVDYDGDYVTIHNGCPVHGDIVLHHAHWNNRMKPERRQNHMICPLCHPIGIHSGFEIEVMQYLDTLGLEYSKNNRTVIKPLELDFVFDNNVAIEVNGIYYHNTEHKPVEYHKNKQDAAVKAGYDLLQIWEHDFAHRRPICLNYIDDFLGLNKPVLDNVIISVIDNNTAEEFRKCCSFKLPMKYDTCIGIVNENGDDIYGIAYIHDCFVVGIVADIGIDWCSVFDVLTEYLESQGIKTLMLNYENTRIQHILSKGYEFKNWFPGLKWFDNNGQFEEVDASINPNCFEFETAGSVMLEKE